MRQRGVRGSKNDQKSIMYLNGRFISLTYVAQNSYLSFSFQEEYAHLIQNLLASQTDAAVRQRLIDSFNKLIPPDADIAVDKNYKERFRKNLDSFLANVKGLLCVR